MKNTKELLNLVEEMLNNGTNLKGEKFEFYNEHPEVFKEEFVKMFNQKSIIKQAVTEKGLQILKAMKQLDKTDVTAKEIAEAMSLSGANKVTGAMLKLVKDDYVTKSTDHSPTLYNISQKGKDFLANEQ